MKKLFVLFLILLLPACASNPITGDRVGVKMKSADYSRMKQVEADALAAAEFYKAKSDVYNALAQTNDGAVLVAYMMKEALAGAKAPTNSNDVAIAESAASVQKHQIWGGTLKSMVGLGVAYKGIDSLATLGAAAINRPSVQVNADNGSTVEGAIGEGNTYTQTNEQVSGILTEPAPVNPITLGGEDGAEAPIECVDLRPVLPGEEGVDVNGDGLVCSDGNGGVTDN